MKNILIPTDFTMKPLKLINAAIKRFEGEKLNVHLIHAVEPDDSISGLLFLKKRLNLHSLYDDTFLQACEMLKNKHASIINKINIEFYMGSSKYYKNSFLNARQIDAIFLPSDYKFKECSPNSVDPFELWKKIPTPVMRASILNHDEKAVIIDHSIAELLSI